MGIAHTLEKLFQMSDQVWARHANPWSVWTRYPSLPLLALAVWSRIWIGSYALLLVMLVIVWIWINPRIFPKPKSTKNWASRAVLGERVWLTHPKQDIPSHHLRAIKYLNVVTVISFLLALYGLVTLHLWFTIFGTLMTMIGKSWFLDRMVWLFQDLKMSKELYQSWEYYTIGNGKPKRVNHVCTNQNRRIFGGRGQIGYRASSGRLRAARL